MMHHKPLCLITTILVVVGGLNWGLVGLGGFLGRDFNIVHLLLGPWPAAEWIVYLLVGIAALLYAIFSFKCAKDCPCNKQD